MNIKLKAKKEFDLQVVRKKRRINRLCIKLFGEKPDKIKIKYDRPSIIHVYYGKTEYKVYYSKNHISVVVEISDENGRTRYQTVCSEGWVAKAIRKLRGLEDLVHSDKESSPKLLAEKYRDLKHKQHEPCYWCKKKNK